MTIKNVFKKLLGKKTGGTQDADDAPIKFYDSSAPAAFNVSSANEHHITTKLLNITPGQHPNYDKARLKATQNADNIKSTSELDIVILIKERQEALKNIAKLVKSFGFPPMDESQVLYKYLMPTIQNGENAGKVNRSARYGEFKDHQQEIVTFFDGSDTSKGVILVEQKENQKVLSLISWIVALKNFAASHTNEYAKVIDDLYQSQDPEKIKLACILVLLAESPYTDALLSYTGTVRKPEFKILLEDTFRHWYQACKLIVQ